MRNVVPLVLLSVVLASCGRGTDQHGRRQPSTSAERKAARVAIVFAGALQATDLPQACQMARGQTARILRCRGKPRVPSYLEVPANEKLRIDSVVPAEIEGAIGIGIPAGNVPILAVDVDPRGRVV